MDARFLGFSLDVSSQKSSFSSFMEYLAEKPRVIDNDSISGFKRTLHVDCDSNPDFYVGMVVTKKNQKKFCKSKDLEDGEFTFDVQNLKSSEKIIDFNYFIINKSNYFGLYQHYHQSCATRIFGSLLKKLAKTYSGERIQNEIALQEEQGKKITGALKSQIRKEYILHLEFSLLVRKEKLKILLEQYSKIKAFEYDYTTLTPDIKKATPLAKHVLKKREKLRFVNPDNVNTLAREIANFVKKKVISKGSVTVEDEYGNEFPMKVFDMPDYFAVYDFNDLADKLANIQSSTFYQSKIVDLLVGAISSPENSPIFNADVDDAA